MVTDLGLSGTWTPGTGLHRAANIQVDRPKCVLLASF